MSQSADNIIPVTVNIKRGGIGPISFGVAFAAYGDATDPKDQVLGFFTDETSVAERHPTRTDLIDVAKNWFSTGGAALVTLGYQYTAPAPVSVSIDDDVVAIEDKRDKTHAEADVTPMATRMSSLIEKIKNIRVIDTPTNFTEAMTKAADKAWFYFPFSTQTPADLTQEEVKSAIEWCNDNVRFLITTVVDKNATDVNTTDDMGSFITALGLRRSAVCHSLVNKYMGVRAAGMISLTDYSSSGVYKDAEYKSINQTADDFGGSDIAVLKAKGYFFNTTIASKASSTGAMLQNTISASTYNETLSEVIATDSYLINIQTALLNAVTSQVNLPQTPEGQQIAISAGNQIGEQYIANGFLGQRLIIHPVTKEEVITRGYITTTVAEDVYKLTDADRAEHKLYPFNQFIYRSGSAWVVAATINVW